MSKELTTETNPVAELESAFLTARNTLETVSKNALAVAQGGGSLEDIQAAMVTVQKAKAEAVKAENAFKAAEFQETNRVRLAVAVAAHDKVAALVTDSDIQAAFAAGIVGIHMTRDSDGNINVTVNSGLGKSPKAAGTTGGRVGQKRVGKNRWTVNGTTMTTRQMITDFGGDEGVEVINKVDNWQALGLARNPGWEKFAVTLAEKIGAIDGKLAA